MCDMPPHEIAAGARTKLDQTEVFEYNERRICRMTAGVLDQVFRVQEWYEIPLSKNTQQLVGKNTQQRPKSPYNSGRPSITFDRNILDLEEHADR